MTSNMNHDRPMVAHNASPSTGSGALPALKAAFPITIPVMAGYLFLGLTYGIYMHSLGFSWIWPALTAFFIYGGSLEFLVGGMLVGSFNPLASFVIAFAVQARHLFYGISMLGRWRHMGWKKFPLIYGMSDETFSVIYATDTPEGIDPGWFMLWITWLDRAYWVTGSTLGGVFGAMLPFNTEGLSFVMCALFVVIFLDQWDKEKDRRPAFVGLGASIVCLLVFGADNFLIPTLIVMVVALLGIRQLDTTRLPADETNGTGNKAGDLR